MILESPLFKHKKILEKAAITDKLNNRFRVRSVPLGYSNGYAFYLADGERELVDSDGDDLHFKYEDEAEIVCEFLNKHVK